MRRYATPAALISAVCLLVSLAVHLPIYWSLGKLKEALFAEEANRPRGSAPSEVEFNVDDGLTEADLQEEAKRAESKLRDKPPDEQKRDVAKQNEEKKKEVAVAAAVPAEAKPPPPPKPKASQQAIQQKSEDPTVAPPPDAKYLAEENRRVEEETVARERSFTEDSPQPQSGATRNSAGEDPGNDKETEVADSRNREGDASRHATEAEARQERPDSSRTPPPPVAASGNGQRAGGDNGGARAASGAETPEYETLTVQDGSGSFVIRVPKERGERDHARLSDAHGHGDSGAGSGAGAEGRSPRGGLHGEGGGLHHNGPQLALSWRSFLDSVNEDELREDRERYVEERKSRLRGGERQKLWKEFRAAIENFVPSVKPGNQTALNAAASPFANYLTAVHRRIHREYAYEFLAGLPIGGTSPFADPNLVTELEIILNRNGTIHRVGVVSPSGLLAFDYGAWAAVMRGQPYPEAPPQILSGDGRVYFHWGFYRNERQCGTFNAEPYILPNPPGSPAPSPGLDGPLPGGIVPRDSEPTWGTENERSGRNDAAPPGDRVRATLDVAPSRRGS